MIVLSIIICKFAYQSIMADQHINKCKIMKKVNSFCRTLSASTQISILSGLDSIISQVNERFACNIQLVDKETLFADHVLFIGITSPGLIYNCAIHSFCGRVENLMFRYNVPCFARPVLFNVDFEYNVINLIAEFD